MPEATTCMATVHSNSRGSRKCSEFVLYGIQSSPRGGALCSTHGACLSTMVLYTSAQSGSAVSGGEGEVARRTSSEVHSCHLESSRHMRLETGCFVFVLVDLLHLLHAASFLVLVLLAAGRAAGLCRLPHLLHCCCRPALLSLQERQQ